MAGPGPARGIKFVHTALKREMAAIDEGLRGARDAGAAASAFGARVAFLARVGKLHNDGEEAGMLPELGARVPGVVDSYLSDHVTEQAAMRQLVAAVGTEEAPGALEEARKLAAGIRAHLEEHVRKEEEILVPLLEQHFTIEEQGGHMGKMMGAIPPADLAAALPWLVALLDPGDRAAYVMMLQRAAPPERLPAMLGWIRGGVPKDVWLDLVGKVPSIA